MGPNEQLVGEARLMLTEFMIPIRDNPRHLHCSALPQLPYNYLLQNQGPPPANTIRCLYGAHNLRYSEDIHWKVQFKKDEEVECSLLSPNGTHILVGLTCGYLELRRMDDGSLVRRIVDNTRLQRYDCDYLRGIGFLSEDGGVVASWTMEECFLDYSDSTVVTLSSKMGEHHHHSPYELSEIAATQNTLAVLYGDPPDTLYLIDVIMWTKTQLTIPQLAPTGRGSYYYQPYRTLAFARDSISLIYIRQGEMGPWVLVWNRTTGDLIRNFTRAQPTYSPLYLFPSTSPYANFAILCPQKTETGFPDEDSPIVVIPSAVIIPLVGAQEDNDPFGSQLHATSDAGVPYSVHPQMTCKDGFTLPHHNNIAHSAGSSAVALIDSGLVTISLRAHAPVNSEDVNIKCLLSHKADIMVQVGEHYLSAVAPRPITTSPFSPHQHISTSTISRDARFLACVSKDRHLEVYDLDMQSFVLKIQLQHDQRANQLAFVLNDTYIAIWGWVTAAADNTWSEVISLFEFRIGSRKLIEIGAAATMHSLSGPPVLSSDSFMSIEKRRSDASGHDILFLAQFSPEAINWRQLRSPGYNSWTALMAFSPNDQYVGAMVRIEREDCALVWCASSGDLVCRYECSAGGAWGINRGPSSQQYWASSPFPSPSQQEWYRGPNSSPFPHWPSYSSPSSSNDSSLMTCDNAIFVLYQKGRRSKGAPEIDHMSAFISGASKSIAVIDDAAYIRVGGKQLLWIHPTNLNWPVQRARNRVILQGSVDMPLLVLEVPGLDE